MGKRRIKRRNIDPAVAHERGIKAGRSRTTADYYLRKLGEAVATLTTEQRDRLAELAASASAGEDAP